MNLVLQFAGGFAGGMNGADQRQGDGAVFLDGLLVWSGIGIGDPEKVTVTVSPTWKRATFSSGCGRRVTVGGARTSCGAVGMASWQPVRGQPEQHASRHCVEQIREQIISWALILAKMADAINTFV